jgi:hypothetical protein
MRVIGLLLGALAFLAGIALLVLGTSSNLRERRTAPPPPLTVKQGAMLRALAAPSHSDPQPLTFDVLLEGHRTMMGRSGWGMLRRPVPQAFRRSAEPEFVEPSADSQ